MEDTEIEVDVEGEFNEEFQHVNGDAQHDSVQLKNPWMLESGWSLDHCEDESSKDAIKQMLLEEQFYATGGNGFIEVVVAKESNNQQPESHRKPWTTVEKALFISGLEIYGRSWTKIAELIPDRSVLQVKNYAKRYFHEKAKEFGNITKCEVNSQQLMGHKSESPDLLQCVLDSVTTGSPTVSASALKNPKNVVAKQVSRNISSSSGGNSKQNVTDELSQSGSIKTNIEKEHDTSECHFITKSHQLALDNIKKLLQTDPTVKIIEKADDQNIDVDISDDEDNDHVIDENNLCNLNKKSLHDLKFDETSSVNCAIEDLSIVYKSKTSIKQAHESQTAKNNDNYTNFEDTTQCSVPSNISVGISIGSSNPHSLLYKFKGNVNESLDSAQLQHVKGDAVMKPFDLSKNEVLLAENEPEIDSSTLCGSLVESNIDQEISNLNIPDTENIFDKIHLFDNSSASTEETETLDDISSRENDSVASNGGFLQTVDGENIFFNAPTEEIVLHTDDILEEERKMNSDFFKDKSTKTPQRYLKIRNYLINTWCKQKPKYMSKTAARNGLKHCGDVNCISRIHSYLEQVGAINFGTGLVNYYKQATGTLRQGRMPETKNSIIHGSLTHTMRTRKRMSKDEISVTEPKLANAQEKTLENKKIKYPVRTKKTRTGVESTYDPFTLIPCRAFSDDNPAPFHVNICASCLVMMEVHSHLSKMEVIGLLGGDFNKEKSTLEILTAEPCNSLSTGMQCEMDPVSQTEASDVIQNQGLNVVGWYHSHPTFAPNPSVRDIETQKNFQEWFSLGGQPFIGAIISPYYNLHVSPESDLKCLVVYKEPQHSIYMPYQFDYNVNPVMYIEFESLVRKLSNVTKKCAMLSHRVEMLSKFPNPHRVTCLEKMLISLRRHFDTAVRWPQSLLEEICDLITLHFKTDETSTSS